MDVCVHGERELPRARKVLALIELDDESGVGDPEIAACQHVASYEVADAESSMRLQIRGHVP